MKRMKALGEKIRELREAKDISLREFSRQLGELSAAFVSDVELGRRFPSNDVLAKMARVLGVKLEELKNYDSRPPLEALKRLTASDPTYAALLRTVVEKRERVDPNDVIAFINKQADKKK
jgi:transcriptional regulator with XRE-family HTH domain